VISFLAQGGVSYLIMSNTDSDADSISDTSNTHIDAGDDDSLISSPVRELCNQLRANNLPILDNYSIFAPSNFISHLSEAEWIAIFQALKENTSVKHIDFSMLFRRHHTKKSALTAAEYVESSKTLQTLNFGFSVEVPECEMVSVLLRALSRNTSVTKLIITSNIVRFASTAFQELLTCTQTLDKLKLNGLNHVPDKVQIAALASGFANNTTLSDLEFKGWRAANLAPVLTALQNHPALQKIKVQQLRLSDRSANTRSLSGLEVLLRGQDSKVKELVIEQVDFSTVGLHPVLRELGRNTTITNLVIRNSVLGHENVQQIKAIVRENKALQHLNLRGNQLRNAGLAEIAPALYRNTSIKSLDLAYNDLGDIKSANALRDLIRRNKTITSLCLADNYIGRNAAAARGIFEGVRSNTALQKLDLKSCGLDDRNVLVLANALAIGNASVLELNLDNNFISAVGVRALVFDNVEAVKTLTKLCLRLGPIRSEGAIILADALGCNAMPNLDKLHLDWCLIEDDGLVALVSALEQNTTLQILSLEGNYFSERGFMALAESLPNIKRLQQITIQRLQQNTIQANAGFESTLPLLLEGFRKNTSLVKVDIERCEHQEFYKEIEFLGYRNRFNALLKICHPLDSSPPLGIWSRALAKVATEPSVLFHVLRNNPKLVGSAGDSKKRKRNDE
jgi:Ran GTPase-activating protein (RanGAP) involved in mRNA processing and transport